MKNDFLYKLNLQLCTSNNDKLVYSKGSLLQGVIMDMVSSEYADFLHAGLMNPYSQSIRVIDNNNIWQINTLNETAYNNIIKLLKDETFNSFVLEHNNLDIKIINKFGDKIYYKELTEKFYNNESSRLFEINFLTPTAFKHEGYYLFFPKVTNIFRSLMKRWDSVSENEIMFDEDTLDTIVQNTNIVGYNVRSTKFHLEGVNIPGFIGSIRIKVNGPQTMVNFVRMLLQFANYSGIGIKTSIGMGAVETKEIVKEVIK